MTTFTPDDSATIDPMSSSDDGPGNETLDVAHAGSSSPRPSLRRNRDDRIAAGVAGGLGRYFGVDPVIFRIVFAVLALFGGSGIVLYLLGWLAVPEDGAANAPLDSVVARLRRRSVPVWLAAAVAVFAVWLVGFSWWEPFSFAPAALVGLALYFLLRRRDRSVTDPVAATSASTGSYPASPMTSTEVLDPASVQLRSWLDETRMRARTRRARSAPVTRIAGALLIAALVGLVVVDVVHGIPFGAYFWTAGAIVLGAFLVGLITRRTPRVLSLLLVPIAFGLIAFGTTSARAHDGFGQRTWQPTSSTELQSGYRFGFGQSIVDLSRLGSDTPTRTVRVTQGAGQLRLIIPAGLAVRVDAHVHQGVASLGATDLGDGWQVDTTWSTPAASTTDQVITIDARLSAGQILIDYR